MSRRTAAWLAYSILVLAVLLVILGSLLLLLNARFPPPSGGYILAFLSFLVVGVLIASHRPENPIGWMFSVIGVASVWEYFAQEYAFYALVTHPGALPGGVWMAWTQEVWTASIAWTLLFFALLLFPDGRLPSPRWRPFAWFAAGVLILASLLFAFEPGRLADVRVPNPTGIEQAASIIRTSQSMLLPITLGIALAIAASVVVRFRRAKGEERQQLKWLAYTAGSFLVLAALRGLTIDLPHNNRVVQLAAGILDTVYIAAIPAAAGVAILRYRLYDIDIVINRTLVYGSLTVTLVASYFGVVVVLQRLFVALTGQQSTLAVVASTLMIAAMFNPLRRRIQSFIDRRFYRHKYDARKTLEAFNTKLRDETDLNTLTDDVTKVMRETMQPTHVALWLRPDATSPKDPQAD